MVRSLSNETTKPIDSTVIGFINEGINQVSDELENQFNTVNIALVAAATTLALPSDVNDIEKITYSTALPTAGGVIEYEMQELGVGEFVDATGSYPTTFGGPVVYYRRLSDQNGVITLQFYPIAPVGGYINVYYYSRPQTYDPAAPSSTTDLDPAYQILAIYWAVVQVCETKENLRAKAAYFQQKYENLLQKKLYAAKRRSQRRGAMVRDVTSGGAVGVPWFPL